jgi:hypothetical protein
MGKQTRRGFLATVGAAAAATTVPKVATAAPSTWTGAAGFHGAALRAAYLAEIARFAETLRPRFEKGELRAFADADDGEDHQTSPHWEVERVVAEHLGLEVERIPHEWRTEGPQAHRGDMTTAFLVLAASPHAESTADGYHHPCFHAQTAAGWDLIAYARARSWYTLAPGECADPNTERPA